MNAQHTPGPWEAKGTAGHETHGQWAVYDANGRDIAIVYDGAKHARLIAAAPDLLEALRELMLVMDNQGMRNTPAKNKARAAIAKASQP